MTSLLDVNVLIALLDDTHAHHRSAFRWFLRDRDRAWLTCPITQMAAVRILSSPRYGPGVVSPADVLAALQSLATIGRHTFISDALDLLHQNAGPAFTFPTSSSVTDFYLLALAVHSDADLVTFDRRIAAMGIPGGNDRLVVLSADGTE